MKFVFTKHAKKKFKDLEEQDLKFSQKDVKEIVGSPEHIDKEADYPKLIASGATDTKHVLRVVFKIEDDLITIITFTQLREEDIMKLSKSKKYPEYPKFKYEKEDDVLNIWLSNGRIDYGEQTGDVIVHFTEEKEPVYIEILDASKFLKRQSEDLSQEVKQKFFAAAS